MRTITAAVWVGGAAAPDLVVGVIDDVELVLIGSVTYVRLNSQSTLAAWMLSQYRQLR